MAEPMRAVTTPEPGVVELNYMWLPSFIGMNGVLKRKLEKALKSEIEGRPLSEELLDEAHELVIAFLEKEFPAIHGLREYIDGLKFIEVM